MRSRPPPTRSTPQHKTAKPSRIDPYADLRAAALTLPQRGRLLDVGCGDGTLVGQLRRRGFDASGIDVREPASRFCVQASIEEYVSDARYDVVVARASVHHTAHLGVVFERMRRLLRSGGMLLMEEFSWAAFGRESVRWLRARADAPGANARVPDVWRGSIATALQRWAGKYGELHTLDAMLYAADAFFVRRNLVPVPYLAWLVDRADIAAAERKALRSGALTPLAYLYTGVAR